MWSQQGNLGVLGALLPLLLSHISMTLTFASAAVFTPEHAKAVLEKHNEYRRQETAANMYQMHWNISLQQRADAWIQGCEFKHENCFDAGENLFFSTDHSDGVFLKGLKAWHDEKSLWSYSSGNCMAACHYTQIIWSWTTTVGCSAKVCPSLKTSNKNYKDALLFACYYYPRGNFIGHFPFSQDSPCSRCAEGDTCSDKLCVSSGPESKSAPDIVKMLKPQTPVRENLPAASLRSFQSLVQTYISQARKVPQSFTYDHIGQKGRVQELQKWHTNSHIMKFTSDTGEDHHLSSAWRGTPNNTVVKKSGLRKQERKQHRLDKQMQRAVSRRGNPWLKQLKRMREVEKRERELERVRQKQREIERKIKMKKEKERLKEMNRQWKETISKLQQKQQEEQNKLERKRKESFRERQRKKQVEIQSFREADRKRQNKIDKNGRQAKKEVKNKKEDKQKFEEKIIPLRKHKLGQKGKSMNQNKRKEEKRHSEGKEEQRIENNKQEEIDRKLLTLIDKESAGQTKKKTQRLNVSRTREEKILAQHGEKTPEQIWDEKGLQTEERQQKGEQGRKRMGKNKGSLDEITHKKRKTDSQFFNFRQRWNAKQKEILKIDEGQVFPGQAAKFNETLTSSFKEKTNNIPEVTNENKLAGESLQQHTEERPAQQSQTGSNSNQVKSARNGQDSLQQIVPHSWSSTKNKKHKNRITYPRKIHNSYSVETSMSPSIDTIVRVLSRSHIEELEKEYRGTRGLVIFKNPSSQDEKPLGEKKHYLSPLSAKNRVKKVETFNKNKTNDSGNMNSERVSGESEATDTPTAESLTESNDTLPPLALSQAASHNKTKKAIGSHAILDQKKARSNSQFGPSNIKIMGGSKINSNTQKTTREEERELLIQEKNVGQLTLGGQRESSRVTARAGNSDSSDVPFGQTASERRSGKSNININETGHTNKLHIRRPMKTPTPSSIATIVRVLSRSEIEKLDKKDRLGTVIFRASRPGEDTPGDKGKLQYGYLDRISNSKSSQIYNRMKTSDSSVAFSPVVSEFGVSQGDGKNMSVNQKSVRLSNLKAKGASGDTEKSRIRKVPEKMTRMSKNGRWQRANRKKSKNFSRRKWKSDIRRGNPESSRNQKPWPYQRKYVIDKYGQKCRDRTPMCKAWAWRCSKNRKVKHTCPLTCGTCEHQVKGRRQSPGRVRKYRSNWPRNPDRNGGSLRAQKPNRDRSRNHRYRYRHSKTQHSTKETELMSLRVRPARESRRRDPLNDANFQSSDRFRKPMRNRDKPTASEDECKDRSSHLSACRSWKKFGFCEVNTSVKEVYCRQSCGTCDQQ